MNLIMSQGIIGIGLGLAFWVLLVWALVSFLGGRRERGRSLLSWSWLPSALLLAFIALHIKMSVAGMTGGGAAAAGLVGMNIAALLFFGHASLTGTAFVLLVAAVKSETRAGAGAAAAMVVACAVLILTLTLLRGAVLVACAP